MLTAVRRNSREDPSPRGNGSEGTWKQEVSPLELRELAAHEQDRRRLGLAHEALHALEYGRRQEFDTAFAYIGALSMEDEAPGATDGITRDDAAPILNAHAGWKRDHRRHVHRIAR